MFGPIQLVVIFCLFSAGQKEAERKAKNAIYGRKSCRNHTVLPSVKYSCHLSAHLLNGTFGWCHLQASWAAASKSLLWGKARFKNMHVCDLVFAVTSDEAQGPGNSTPSLLVMWVSCIPETCLPHTPKMLHLQQEIWSMGRIKAMRKLQVQIHRALSYCLSSHTDRWWCWPGQS